MGRKALFLAAVLSCVRASAVEFDCIPIPAVPDAVPPECSDPSHPSYDQVNFPPWCDCMTIGLTNLRAGQAAAVELALIEITDQPTAGKIQIFADGGTLDLSGVALDDVIGQLLVDVPGAPLGLPEDFILDFQVIVTDVQDGEVSFDIIVQPTNATTEAVLTYSPTDAEHAFGLTYRGKATSFGASSGFEFFLEYVQPDQLPLGAISTGIEIGDLSGPGFNVPILLNFPLGSEFRLPVAGQLEIVSIIDQINTDPITPVQREFSNAFTVEGSPPQKPAAPTGVAATAGNGQVNLDWSDNAETDLTGYTVYRSITDGGPYAKVAGPLTASAHLDTGLTNGTPYYYVVTASNPAGESPNSAQASAVPAAPAVGFRRADANGDRGLDLSDAIATLEFLFLGGDPLTCPDAADTNDDGVVDLSDAISSLGYQFLGAEAPPAPGPSTCGEDPSGDTLGACVYNC